MMLSILILMTSACLKALLMALAMCLIPALLGWLAAQSYFKVGELRDRITSLTGEAGSLTGKVNSLTDDLTNLRVKHTQLEAELDSRNQQMSKYRSDLMLVESDRNMWRSKWQDHEAGLLAGGSHAVAAAHVVASVMFNGKKYKGDDLKIVEGIGPKIEELLHNAGIKTWKALSETAADSLKKILDTAGPNFQIHDPGSWPEQAHLAHQGDWDALKALQDRLTGGRA